MIPIQVVLLLIHILHMSKAQRIYNRDLLMVLMSLPLYSVIPLSKIKFHLFNFDGYAFFINFIKYLVLTQKLFQEILHLPNPSILSNIRRNVYLILLTEAKFFPCTVWLQAEACVTIQKIRIFVP